MNILFSERVIKHVEQWLTTFLLNWLVYFDPQQCMEHAYVIVTHSHQMTVPQTTPEIGGNLLSQHYSTIKV